MANYKLLDAGWGKQGFFTLVSGAKGQLFIHYNKQPDGYAVFKMRGMNEDQAQDINRQLAEILRKEAVTRAAEGEGE